MSGENRPLIRITIGLREAKCLMAAAVILAVPLWLSSESLTLSTTYPSPAGIYKKLISTGDTILGRDTGSVVIGAAAPTAKLTVGGSVSATGAVAAGGAVTAGAGVSAAGDIASGGALSAVGGVAAGGVVRVGLLASDPPGAPGGIYFNTTTQKFMGYQNGQWSDLAAPATGSGPVPGGLYGGCKVGMTSGGGGMGGGSNPPKFYCFDVSAPASCAVSVPTAGSQDICGCPSGYTKTVTGQYNTGSSTGPTYSCRKD